MTVVKAFDFSTEKDFLQDAVWLFSKLHGKDEDIYLRTTHLKRPKQISEVVAWINELRLFKENVDCQKLDTTFLKIKDARGVFRSSSLPHFPIAFPCLTRRMHGLWKALLVSYFSVEARLRTIVVDGLSASFPDSEDALARWLIGGDDEKLCAFLKSRGILDGFAEDDVGDVGTSLGDAFLVASLRLCALIDVPVATFDENGEECSLINDNDYESPTAPTKNSSTSFLILRKNSQKRTIPKKIKFLNKEVVLASCVFQDTVATLLEKGVLLSNTLLHSSIFAEKTITHMVKNVSSILVYTSSSSE